MSVATDYILNSCIRIEEIRINRRVTIPRQIHFCLDSVILQQIEQAEANNQKLILSPANLANLRYYALINSLEKIDPIYPSGFVPVSLRRSLLTFSTNYRSTSCQQPLTLFRSVIDLEGKISQQIPQQLWDNPLLLEKISQAHYWLISEILDRLPLKQRNCSSRYVYCCFLLMAIATTTAIWYFFSLNILLNLAIGCTIFCLLACFKKSIVKQVRTWIISQLVTGFLATSLKKRQLSLNLLSLIV
jgi:hypothetical protein